MYFYLFRTEETINYTKIRKWFLNNALYIKSIDELIQKVNNNEIKVSDNTMENSYDITLITTFKNKNMSRKMN